MTVSIDSSVEEKAMFIAMLGRRASRRLPRVGTVFNRCWAAANAGEIPAHWAAAVESLRKEWSEAEVELRSGAEITAWECCDRGIVEELLEQIEELIA